MKEDTTQLELNVKDTVTQHIEENFIFSEEDEKIFQKLLKLRSTIDGAFSNKFKIEMMKKIIEESEVVRFTSQHDSIIDRNVPVFRVTIKLTEKYLSEYGISDNIKEYISKKICPKEEEDSAALDELTHIRSQILSKEVFDKYLDTLVNTFEQHFQDDNKLKEEYSALYDEIFQVLPEKQIKEFICSGIFHVRFFKDSLFNGQFEFIF
jgi:hypothetical protein